MCNVWWSISDTIRTLRRRVGRQVRQGDALVSFAVIQNKFIVIIENIHGIDKCINDISAVYRVSPVAVCETVEEEQDPIRVEQLGLRITEGFTGYAEGIRFILQRGEPGGG